MMIVLDCSAAVEMVTNTARGNAFRMLMLKDENVYAPVLFRVEVLNTFWKYVYTNKMTFDEAKENIEDAVDLVDEFCDLDDMADEVFAEAVNTKHSVYDLFYLVLARRHGATLFTVDQKLIELCIQMHVNCTEEIDF